MSFYIYQLVQPLILQSTSQSFCNQAVLPWNTLQGGCIIL